MPQDAELFCIFRKGDEKSGSLMRLAFHRYFPMVLFHDGFADIEPEAAVIFCVTSPDALIKPGKHVL